MSICPICEQKWSGWTGKALNVRAYFKRYDVHLTTHEAQIVAALVAKKAPMRFESLVDVLYGEDPEGGPDNAVGTLRVHIHRLRRKLSALSVEIVNVYGKGYAIRNTESLPGLKVMAYALLIPLFLSFPVMALAHSLCRDRDEIAGYMLEKYGETQRSLAFTSANKPLQLFVNDETESWTLIVYPDGSRGCVFASGHGWYDKPTEGDPLI